MTRKHGVVHDPLRPLLAAAADGDQRALGAFVEATQGAVWRVCTNLGSPGEEEDLVQETYLRAVKAAPAFRGEAPALAWLMTIARRTCADHVRSRQRRRRLLERVRAHTTEVTAPAVDAPDDLLAALTPDRRDAFVLTQLAGLSYEEAAEALGCPIGTVRSRVARARADLLDLVAAAEAS